MYYIDPDKISYIGEYTCIVDGVQLNYNNYIKREEVLKVKGITLKEAKKEPERIIEVED